MVRFLADTRKAPVKNKPLLVIGAGLPRTATSSLQVALEDLGFGPCLHMAHIIPHAERQQLLIDASRETDTEKRHKQIHELVDGHGAVVDIPAIFFLEDLMHLYPEAKVVLSSRPDPEIWAQSARNSLRFFFTRRFYWIGLLWSTDRLWYKLNMRIVEWCRERIGEGDIFTASSAVKYNEQVRELVAARGGEVLEFRAEDGWAPLCRYLEKEVPDKPFPKVNEKATFALIKNILIAKGLISWAALGGVLWLGWTYVPRGFI
ncbi:unnamed protein product [Penicillium salamii]|uniref:NAD dependent epimerase/dehydratase n=1 Tax=Penicillium salamii TaxID=1612424 RepID=A0A9W4J538_9EURO|nr:unnamed protein product [Penicillium salamii]